MNVTAQAGDTLFTSGSANQGTAAIKASLRRSLRQSRKQISLDAHRRAARAVAQRLVRSGLLKRVRRAAVYQSYGSELRTQPLITALLDRRIEVFVPVIVQDRLLFEKPSSRQAAWRGGRRFRASAMDLMVLPLLGFDARGMRLGQGGGHYDRALSACRHRPRRLGLAFAIQQVAELPGERWDVPLHAVLTERGLHRFHRHSTGA